EENFPGGLRFIDGKSVADLSHFPPDMGRVPVQVNRLNNQALVRYFDAEWARYSQQ
ncbi:MAG: spermidine synthase, partial [Verrucomicrobiota bacterium]